MSPALVALILFGTFGALVLLRIPVAFALGLACVPVFFISDRLSPSLLFDQMFGSYNSFILLAVPFFLLAANLMNSAGITQRLIDLARSLVGHLPGGLGHVNVVVSMLFAGISGSSTADAAGIGSLLIPQMKKQGYDTSFSVAITACSSVMGVIIPPSILMVVWGGLMSVSIGGMFLAGVVPGLLIAGSMMLIVHWYAVTRGYPVYVRSTWADLGKAFARSFLALSVDSSRPPRHQWLRCCIRWCLVCSCTEASPFGPCLACSTTQHVSPPLHCSVLVRHRRLAGFWRFFRFPS